MNLDSLKRFPQQNIELRPDECVGETFADIIGNIEGQPMDAGFSFAAALRASNTTPTTRGANGYSGAIGVVIYGCLPTKNEPFDATTTSELYEANFNNYPTDLRLLASHFVQEGIKELFSYTEIADSLAHNRVGIQLTMKWYESFLTPQSDGTLPEPKGDFLYHSVAVYEDALQGLCIKPWLGEKYRYSFIPPSLFPLVFVSACTFIPATRWLSLAKIALARPYLIDEILPQMLKS